jgi:C4-dicarboxylate transporter, DctM subunit
MEWYVIALAAFSFLVVLLLAGIPVSFALLMVAFTGLVWEGAGLRLVGDLPHTFFSQVNSFVMTSIPLFVLMAMLIEQSGFTRLMFDAVQAWLGRLPGSLAMVGVAACTIFAAVCGGSAANAAAVGIIAIPEYKRNRCDKQLCVGAIAAGGSLGILIPPSIPMIFYCVICEQSIGTLFMAGILPGLMTSALFLLFIYIRCRLNPTLVPLGPMVSWRVRWQKALGLIPIAIIIFIVLGSIYLGVATPTESAAVGCFGALVLGIATRKLSFSGLKKSLFGAIRVNGFLLLIVLGALSFGQVLNRGHVTTDFINFMTGLQLPTVGILVMINFLYLFLGCFMDPTPIILTTMPILYPLSRQLGLDPIWFGIMTVMNLELAGITPPVGFNLFVLKGIAGDYISTADIIRGAMPFGLLYVLALILVMVFPQIALFLPNLMMGYTR